MTTNPRQCFKGTVLRETERAWQFVNAMDPDRANAPNPTEGGRDG